MLSSNCGTKFEDGVGVLKLGKVESTSWGWFKKPQLATSTLTSTSKIGSWGHEVEALSYRSWRLSWGQVGGLWTTLIGCFKHGKLNLQLEPQLNPNLNPNLTRVGVQVGVLCLNPFFFMLFRISTWPQLHHRQLGLHKYTAWMLLPV